MNRYELKQLRKKYRHCIPSMVITNDNHNTQYYCANWSSIEEVRKLLGLNHISECEHIKFNLEDWFGSDEQLQILLNTCDQAKLDQVSKFGSIGWYVLWSKEGLSFNSHK